MADYTDDKGEMDGLDVHTPSLEHRFPPVEAYKHAIVEIVEEQPDGSERIVELYHRNSVKSVVVTAPGKLKIQYADGRLETAPIDDAFTLRDERI